MHVTMVFAKSLSRRTLEKPQSRLPNFHSKLHTPAATSNLRQNSPKWRSARRV